jgi:hypothetical protein
MARTGTTSPKQLIAQTNAICTRAAEKARPLTSATGKLKPELLGAAATLLKQTESELRALAPPAALAAGYQRFLALANAEIKLVAELATAISDRDLNAAHALTTKLSSSASNQAAEKVGLTVCAKETG